MDSGKSIAKPYNDWPNDAGFDAVDQQFEPVELKVTGTFPAVLAGTLYRTGPGTYRAPGSTYQRSHWFDGFTTVHKFQLMVDPKSGTCKVLYNSRSQCDELIEKARRKGTLDGITFGQKRDPCESIFQKIKTVFAPSLDGNDAKLIDSGVTIHPNPPGAPRDPFLATAEPLKEQFGLTTMTDFNMLKHLDPKTLEPTGVTRQQVLHHELTGELSCAHAAYDPKTGDLYNYNLALGRISTYRVFRVSASTGKTHILATIQGQNVKPAYVHSFFQSENYVILGVWPCLFKGYGLKLLWQRNVVDAIGFDPDVPARWYVIDKRPGGRGLVAEYQSDPFFCFHTINAFEQEQPGGTTVDIMCDLIRHPNDDIIHRLYYENIVSTRPGASETWTNLASNPEAGWRPQIARYCLTGVPLEQDTSPVQKFAFVPSAVETKKIVGKFVPELPTINPLFATKESRYVYGTTMSGRSSFIDGLAKFDMKSDTMTTWMKDKHTPGEAIFVPKKSGSGEDEENKGGEAVEGPGEDHGYLLSVVLDGEKGTSYLLCLDARDLTEVGRAECGIAVGFGFHGAHCASATASKL